MELAQKIVLLQRRLVKSELVGRSVKLSAITFAANVLGFLIPVYIAYVYGISRHTDYFFLSYGIITFINIVFSSAISSVTVPFVKENANDVTWLSNFISAFFFYCGKFVGLALLLALGVLFTTSRLSDNELFFYLTLSVPILFFSILNSFCYGILNSLDQYNTAALSPFSRAVIIFTTIFLFSRQLGVIAVILGYNLGELTKLVQLLYVIGKRNGIAVSLRVRDYSLIKSFIREGSLQAVSSSISCAAPLIDKVVASFLVVGSLSILDYGDKVAVILAVLLNAFLVVVLTKWSGEVVAKTFRFNRMVHILSCILGLSIVSFILVAFGKTMIVDLLYPRLSGDKKNIIAWVILLNTAGFVFNSVNQVINIGNIAFKATSVLVYTSVIKAVINLALDIVLGIKWGVTGIVAATVCVHLIGLVLNFLIFKYRVYRKYDSGLSAR